MDLVLWTWVYFIIKRSHKLHKKKITMIHTLYDSVEITNKMQPCNRNYYPLFTEGIINSVTRLHLVGYFY